MFNMIQNLHSPCHVCTNRSSGCHGTCSSYLEFKSKVDKDRELRREGKKTLSTRRLQMNRNRYA